MPSFTTWSRPDDGACHHAGADETGVLAERRGDDVDGRTVPRPFELPAEELAQRLEQHVAELDEAAGDHDELGVEDVDETDETDRDAARILADEREGIGLTSS